MKVSYNINAIQNAYKNINKSAENIATGKLERLPEDMVNLMINQRDIEANLKVVKTYDQLLGSVIDIFA